MKVLKFSASWCSPCNMLAKVLEDYTGDVEIVEVDIDEDFVLPVKFGIRGVPTLVLLDGNGGELRRKSGMLMINQFEDFINGVN